MSASVEELQAQIAEERRASASERETWQAELARLTEALKVRPRQDDVDRVTAQYNRAQQALNDQNQEVDRLRGVLADMVNGLTSWVPDLTPVPAPPQGVDPTAWVRDQIAARRAEWDSFVNRVVTQATV